MKTILVIPALFGSFLMFAQPSETLPVRVADFLVTPVDEGYKYTAVVPPLQQIAGAPPAYFSCFWEFGDGSFSTEKQPFHVFEKNDSVETVLHLTLHYDDGDMPKKKKKKQNVASGLAEIEDIRYVIPDVDKTIGLKNNREPRALEELTLVLSYRNNSLYTTDGVVHLFFNEDKFGRSLFQFQEARTHHGEIPDPLLTDAGPTPGSFDWLTLSEGLSSTGDQAFLVFKNTDAQSLLAAARGTYRDEKAWRFTDLRTAETRNMFLTLEGSENMLRDTSAFVHMLGVFVPLDPAVPPDSFALEMEIVNSHDPNAIAVSDTRVGYRKVQNKQLDYKVRFQNNGERQAETVELTVEVPEGLNTTQMRPIDWYPKCPICPEVPTQSSCLDTAFTKDGLVFTFRNIYLPGSNQRGVMEYDSTKGFVKYRIEPQKGMPKRSFSSRASIVFDKNPPIVTHRSKTRFKTGLSTGLKVGYGFDPENFEDGYVLFGASLSPYQSWKVYPQLELLTGIKGQETFPSDTTVTRIHGGNTTGVLLPDTATYTITNGYRSLLSFEMPLLLRKNFSKFIGVGLGASLRVVNIKGEDEVYTRVREEYFEPGFTVPYAIKGLSESTETVSVSETNTYVSFFAGLTLGSVRIGPNVGIRAGGILDDGVKPFVQLSLEFKL
ncbi:MAG: hypothetical protein IT270_09690 [Saprospiraceae bacterium]|nr:hypothetical protein [Saprospiraceae bacterium]